MSGSDSGPGRRGRVGGRNRRCWRWWWSRLCHGGAAARGGERRSRSERNRRRKPLGLAFEVEENGRKETTAFEVK